MRPAGKNSALLYVGAACAGGLALMAVFFWPAKAWANGSPIGTIWLERVDGHWLRKDVAKAWRAMRDAAKADGVELALSSGFRTYKHQARLRAEFDAGTRVHPVAKPGFSNHQNGRAVDIEVGGTNTSVRYGWLAKNAGRFGFRNTGRDYEPPEHWHWEFFS